MKYELSSPIPKLGLHRTSYGSKQLQRSPEEFFDDFLRILRIGGAGFRTDLRREGEGYDFLWPSEVAKSVVRELRSIVEEEKLDISIEAYKKLTQRAASIADLLAMPGVADIAFDAPRLGRIARPADLS